MTFGFFNFLNFDSVNCHRVPQHLLRYLRNWLFLQITLIGDLVLATKGFGKGGRLYVWPCPGPWLVFSSLKFTVIYWMYRHIRKQMPHYDHQPEHATITSSGINTRSTGDGLWCGLSASNYNFLTEGTFGRAASFAWVTICQVSGWIIMQEWNDRGQKCLASSQSLCLSKVLLCEENSRSVPPATQTLDEIKGHPWKLKR